MHGTQAKNVPLILEKGITRGGKYVCPLPNASQMQGEPLPYGLREMVRRTVGSILFASNYAFEESIRELSSENLDEGLLPAIVILKGKRPGRYSYVKGYDDDIPRHRVAKRRIVAHKSFGKDTAGGTAGEIAGVVRITKSEHEKILRKIRERDPARRKKDAEDMAKREESKEKINAASQYPADERLDEISRQMHALLTRKTLRAIGMLIQGGRLETGPLTREVKTAAVFKKQGIR